MWVSRFKNLRWAAVVLSVTNAVVFLLGCFFLFMALPSCDHHVIIPLMAVPFLAAVRIVTMVNTGLAQEATAMTILEHSPANSPAAVDAAFRHETRLHFRTLRSLIVFKEKEDTTTTTKPYPTKWSQLYES